MTKISVTGPKTQLEDTVDTLHDLGVMDIDSYEGELETGEPMDGSESVSELLVDIRSLISKLDPVGSEELTISEARDAVDEISGEIKKLESQKEELTRSLDNLVQKKEFYEKLKGLEVDFERIKDTESLDFKILDFDSDRFAREANTNRYEVYSGENTSVLVYSISDSDAIEEALRAVNADVQEYSNGFSGTPSRSLEQIKAEISSKQSELEKIEEQMEAISSEWGPRLNYVEEYLTEKIEKSEAPLNFATTDKTFIAEGWIPTDKESKIRDALNSATENRIHIQTEEGENPPVKYDNNRAVSSFESLTDLMARPQYGEIDPSFLILLTFPLFFGFMIGDAGYGITSALVFYGGMKMFPQASKIFKSLLWCSAFTFIFGLIFGDAFGYIIFGEGNALTAATGLQVFESIPLLYHRTHHLNEIFMLSALIGVLHVNLGILVGAYNEYISHGLMEAVFAKGSWILLELAALTGYLVSNTYGTTPGIISGLGIAAPSLIMLYKGEGVEGVVEIPSLISNILSYLRLFGVTVAAISLAKVVNAVAAPAFATGTAWSIVAGVAILMFGHTFNTFIKIMEGFLQGIRLHYVEHFGWFYHGGGRKYSPFGGDE